MNRDISCDDDEVAAGMRLLSFLFEFQKFQVIRVSYLSLDDRFTIFPLGELILDPMNCLVHIWI